MNEHGDACRDGDTFVVELDLPGVDPESIDLDVERNVTTATKKVVLGRPHGGHAIG